jgi:uncharacterized membrane protein
MRPRPITLQDLPNLPEIFLGLAALLVIIAGAAGGNPVIVVMGLIMGLSALISLGFMENPLSKNMFSFLTVSATFGVLLFIMWIEDIVGATVGWTPWVILISSLLSIFAAYRAILLRRY